jgi:hypothetical protein
MLSESPDRAVRTLAFLLSGSERPSNQGQQLEGRTDSGAPSLVRPLTSPPCLSSGSAKARRILRFQMRPNDRAVSAECPQIASFWGPQQQPCIVPIMRDAGGSSFALERLRAARGPENGKRFAREPKCRPSAVGIYTGAVLAYDRRSEHAPPARAVPHPRDVSLGVAELATHARRLSGHDGRDRCVLRSAERLAGDPVGTRRVRNRRACDRSE